MNVEKSTVGHGEMTDAAREWLRIEARGQVERSMARSAVADQLWQNMANQVIADQATREAEARQPDESTHE